MLSIDINVIWQTFCMVLEWLPVSDAGALWARYADDLCQDHLRSGIPAEMASDRALLEIRTDLGSVVEDRPRFPSAH